MRPIDPQTALNAWRHILHKERWGIALTETERAMLFEPRDCANVLAELAGMGF